MKMKVLLALSCFVAVSMALDKEFLQKMKQELQEVGAKCVEQENPVDDDVNRMLSHQFPETHKGKCVIYCIYKHYNTINDDGTINVEAGIAALDRVKENDEEIYNKIVSGFKKCADSVKESDPCETGPSLFKCVLVEGKALGLTEELFNF